MESTRMLIPKHKIPNTDDTLRIYRGDELLVEKKNLRMRNSVLLITECLKNPAGTVGLSHVAIGTGIGSGSLSLPEEPRVGGTQLRKEFFRQPLSSLTFDDTENDKGDTISDGVRTNRLLVYAQIPAADSAELITEAAVFGGNGAENEDGGTMFSWLTFPVVDNRAGGSNPDAPEDLTFSWTLKLPFVNLEESE